MLVCLFCVLFVASVIAHRCSNFWCSAALVLGYFVTLSTSGGWPVQSSTALATWPLQRSAASDPGRLDLSTLLALSNARPLQRLALVACPFAHCFAPTLCRSRDRFLRVFGSSAALVLARSGLPLCFFVCLCVSAWPLPTQVQQYLGARLLDARLLRHSVALALSTLMLNPGAQFPMVLGAFRRSAALAPSCSALSGALRRPLWSSPAPVLDCSSLRSLQPSSSPVLGCSSSRPLRASLRSLRS